MERLFIYIFIALAIFAGIMFWVYKRYFVEEEQERNFTPGESPDDTGYVSPAPREVAAYEERQSSFGAMVVKRAPKTILTLILLQICTHLLTGYFSVTNSERIAKAGADVTQGDYGGAISSLFTMAKPELLEQSRLATGNHPECPLGFAYVGKLNDEEVCIMDHLYSVRDHDETISKDDVEFNKIMKGQSIDNAKRLCDERFEAKLISKEEWELSRSHILAAKNVKAYNEIPEWTRNVSDSDNNDYYVIVKDSGIWKYAAENDFDREEGGYIDNGDMVNLNKGGFRCSITWK